MTQATSKFDLEERTAQFGENVINLCQQIALTPLTRSLVDQLVRSATSIGANYMEANGGSSRKDFRNKIHICKKEAQETQHWLRILNKAAPNTTKMSSAYYGKKLTYWCSPSRKSPVRLSFESLPI